MLCVLLLTIRKDRPKKRHWVYPVVCNKLLNGQFYKLYEDLRNCGGKFFNYFRMSIESFDKLLVLVGPRITYENTRLSLISREIGSNTKVRKYLLSHNTVFQIPLSVRYTNKLKSQNLQRKIKKGNKLTDALLNQQIREKRRHYAHLHLTGRCVTGERAGQRLL